MNRTDRLYALVEELRAVAPRPRSAPWLARRFEVSVCTVERDLDALRQGGVPIYSEAGRAGGYTLDRDRTLPPLTLTPSEALAISIALRTASGTPFAGAAREAALKVRAVLPADVRDQEHLLAQQVHRVYPPDESVSIVGANVQAALAGSMVLQVNYTDAVGATTERAVEPMGLLWGPMGWYLVGWCRLRNGVRGFQLDRIGSARLTDEYAPRRQAELRAELNRWDAEPLEP